MNRTKMPGAKSQTPMPVPQFKPTKKQEDDPLMKWVTRAALLLLFFAGCSWLDTIKVCPCYLLGGKDFDINCPHAPSVPVVRLRPHSDPPTGPIGNSSLPKLNRRHDRTHSH